MPLITSFMYQIQEEGNLNAVLIDTSTGETVLTAENIVDFNVCDEEIIFYCNGSIEKYFYSITILPVNMSLVDAAFPFLCYYKNIDDINQIRMCK